MSHPNIPKERARPWLAGEVQEPELSEDDWWRDFQPWAMPGDEQQQEQEQ